MKDTSINKKQKLFNFFIVVSLIFSFCFFQHRLRVISEHIEHVESSIFDIESRLDDAEDNISSNNSDIEELTNEVRTLSSDLDDITN